MSKGKSKRFYIRCPKCDNIYSVEATESPKLEQCQEMVDWLTFFKKKCRGNLEIWKVEKVGKKK